jgi:hypothetical protein
MLTHIRYFHTQPSLKFFGAFAPSRIIIHLLMKQKSTSKGIQKLIINPNEKYQDNYLQSLNNYYSTLGIINFEKLLNNLYTIKPFSKRISSYQSIQPLLNKLDKPFHHIIIARNEFAQKKGFNNYLDFIISNDHIPKNKFQFFQKNFKSIIQYFKNNLPKIPNLPKYFYHQLNLPCLTYFLPFPKYSYSQIIKQFFPKLKNHKQKFRIVNEDNAYTLYLPNKNIYKVAIRKNVNCRHQTLDLIHELSHVQYFINKKNKFPKSKYHSEKYAISNTFNILKSISTDIYQASFLEVLTNFIDILFEISIYQNPKQNYSKLYAQFSNQCYPDSHQKNNDLYLIKQRIINKPLSSLNHCIAYTDIFSKDIIKQ